MKGIYWLIILSLVTTLACRKEQIEKESPIHLPTTAFNYANIELPFYLTTSLGLNEAAILHDNTPISNPITNEGATLGRVLFYDKKLSKNGTISCASCHQQEKGFSDDNVLSIGFDGGLTRRHSMSLINAVWNKRGHFFWDERAITLEEQVLMPFQDEVEMGLTLQELIDIVANQDYYADLFEDAFGTKEVTSQRIALALAQFVRSIVSVNSKYDEGRVNAENTLIPFSNFTRSENNGKRLFFLEPPLGAGCVRCHVTEAFVNLGNTVTNIGLDSISTNDLGVFESNNNPNLVGAFRVPSLKSIALTAPYMHDGRFETLEEVVEHYASQIKSHPNLSPQLKTPSGAPIQLNLTANEKTDLVNFLKTLTDETISTDEKFSNPFK